MEVPFTVLQIAYDAALLAPIPLSATYVQTMVEDIGVTFTATNVTDTLTGFFGIAGVSAVIVLAIALKFVPQIAGAVRSLAGRR